MPIRKAYMFDPSLKRICMTSIDTQSGPGFCTSELVLAIKFAHGLIQPFKLSVRRPMEHIGKISYSFL